MIFVYKKAILDPFESTISHGLSNNKTAPVDHLGVFLTYRAICNTPHLPPLPPSPLPRHFGAVLKNITWCYDCGWSFQIHIDVPRMNPEVPLFQQQMVQEVSQHTLSVSRVLPWLLGCHSLLYTSRTLYTYRPHTLFYPLTILCVYVDTCWWGIVSAYTVHTYSWLGISRHSLLLLYHTLCVCWYLQWDTILYDLSCIKKFARLTQSKGKPQITLSLRNIMCTMFRYTIKVFGIVYHDILPTFCCPGCLLLCFHTSLWFMCAVVLINTLIAAIALVSQTTHPEQHTCCVLHVYT